MWSPIDWTRINRATVRGIFYTRESASQKLPWRCGIIPTASEIVLIGIKPAPKATCPRRRGRQKQICILRVLEIGLGKQSEVFVRSHSEIVRSAKGGHFAFHTEKNLLRLRR
jgi:hypothetical protein